VLFSAGDGAVIGAAHAGWRGLAAGVLENTVAQMRSCGAVPENIVVWLGPAISAAHFEVGDEVRAAFLQVDAAADCAFARNARGRWQCDLVQLARQRLAALGIQNVTGGNHCTYAEEALFHSHRRDVQHRHQPGTGRMATFIWRAP
jgi:YfiH family protein